MEYAKEHIKEMPELIKVVVVGLDIVKSKDVYGDKATNPEKEVLNIVCENAELGIKLSETVNYYPAENKKVPANSKLGKLITKYSGLKIGSVISLILNKEGFYKLVLA